MAPTICTEKKRQVRSTLKELRRQTNSISTTAASSSSSGIGGGIVGGGGSSVNGNGNNLPSSIINYVAKGALSTSLRLRGNGSSPSSNNSNSNSANKIASEQRLHLQQQQISDNAVSSSTHSDSEQQQEHQRSTRNAFGYRERRLMHLSTENDDEDMHELGDELDEADSEVHSINSACSNMISRSNSSDGAPLLRCTALKTVFPAPALSDKQLLPINSNIALATNSSHRSSADSHSNSPNKCYHSAATARRSDTYTNMCELKNTEGLLAIAIKTIKLVKRNQLLQRRLAQLQLETSEFIQSVLANPENQHFRDKMQTSTTASMDTVVASVKASSSTIDKLELEWSSSSSNNSNSQQEQHV